MSKIVGEIGGNDLVRITFPLAKLLNFPEKLAVYVSLI